MAALIKFIIICLAIYLFFKIVIRSALLYFVRRQLEKMQGNANQSPNKAADTDSSDDTDTSAGKSPKTRPNPNQPFKGGDYIDYEEVR